MGLGKGEVWGMGGFWVMLCISPQTDLVDTNCYGVREVMGFQRYGIREAQLYILYYMQLKDQQQLIATGLLLVVEYFESGATSS